MKIPVAILAGGVASRLSPLTTNTSKSMIRINGKHFIDHQLSLLQNQGCHVVIVCLGKFGNEIRNHIQKKKWSGMELLFSEDGETPLGTGGAISKAARLISDHVSVLYGDSYLTADLNSIESAFFKSNRPCLMSVFKNENSYELSNVLIHKNQLVMYSKTNRTPEMRHIDYGFSIFKKECFTNYSSDTPWDLSVLQEQLVKSKQVEAFEVYERFYEIGSFNGIENLDRHLKERRV
jgi:NDP-sugar pyrophosphorylase family protein